MGKLFNTSVLVEQTSSGVVNLESYQNIEEFCTLEALDFIRQSDASMLEASKNFYKSIAESAGDQELIEEGFKDFMAWIKKGIDNIIKFMKKMIDKFIIKLNSLIGRDTYIKNHKSDLDKFSGTFEFEGYKYEICPITPSSEVIDNMTAEMKKAVDFKSEKSTEAILNKLKTYYDDMGKKHDDKYFDRIRGQILHYDNKAISASNYKNELFKFFRSGEDKESTIVVNATSVGDTYKDFIGIEDDLKKLKESQNKVEKSYNELKDTIVNIFDSSKNDIPVTVGDVAGEDKSADITAMIDLISKAEATRVQNVANIHLMAYAEKCDAISAKYKQDRAILFNALGQVAKQEGFEFEGETIDYSTYSEDIDSFEELTTTGNSKADDEIKRFETIKNPSISDFNSFKTFVVKASLGEQMSTDPSYLRSILRTLLFFLIACVPVAGILVLLAIITKSQREMVKDTKKGALYDRYVSDMKHHREMVSKALASEKDPDVKDKLKKYLFSLSKDIDSLDNAVKSIRAQNRTMKESAILDSRTHVTYDVASQATVIKFDY